MPIGDTCDYNNVNYSINDSAKIWMMSFKK